MTQTMETAIIVDVRGLLEVGQGSAEKHNYIIKGSKGGNCASATLSGRGPDNNLVLKRP